MRQSFWLLVSLVIFVGCTHSVFSQSLSGQDRDRGLIMLKAARDDIRKNYYDPAFRGVDLDARTKVAEERIKQAKSNAEIFGIIAQLLLERLSHRLFAAAEAGSGGLWLADADVWQRLLCDRSEAKE